MSGFRARKESLCVALTLIATARIGKSNMIASIQEVKYATRRQRETLYRLTGRDDYPSDMTMGEAGRLIRQAQNSKRQLQLV